MQEVNLTIWNEFVHEQNNEFVQGIYPKGIHGAIADFMRKQAGFNVRTATLDEPENGLTQEILDSTDVLTWWGHAAHDRVADETVDRVQARILEGMGLIVLHSGHYSKIFRRMMGTGCDLAWREDAGRERMWVVNPAHPIAAGVDQYIELPNTEMYGEFFNIPDPDELVFIGWFEGGEVFRSGATWQRGRGRIFYFQPGHETFPIFHNEQILQVLANAVRWARFGGTRNTTGIGGCYHREKPLEAMEEKDYQLGALQHPGQPKK